MAEVAQETSRPNAARRERRRTRTAGAAARAAATEDAGAPNPANLNLSNPFPPIRVFSEDQIEAIHETSMTMLEEIGLNILLDEAREIFRAAGADVNDETQRVRFDRNLILEAVGKAPSSVTLYSRNPHRDITFGGNRVVFATVGGPPNVSCLEHGRRPGTLAAFEDLLRLAQSFDVLHVITPMVEPIDIAPGLRHLEMTRSMALLTDKIPFLYSRGREAVADSLEMMRISRGASWEEFQKRPGCYTVINANSPLQLDIPMCKGIIDFAKTGQLMILTPFTLAGAMAPVTIAGALAQQNAEALTGIALSQLVNPGAPVTYGGFTSNVDMKSGAPAFGTPEYVHAAFASGQLARRYNLPWRSSNTNASNTPDAQAAYESQMSLWGALMGGCNFLLHGAGWLEGGLTASMEKFIIDVEMLQMFARVFQPPPCDSAALGLDAIREVGPGGHYFGCAHTLERYENAFYAPMLSDWRNFETWQEGGSVNATDRAHKIYKDTIAAFEPPPLDPAIRDELDAFVAKRTEEGGANLES
ncbi:MAG: trimethylamine methyltransferase family protein [Pseudomonadota bacterium]